MGDPREELVPIRPCEGLVTHILVVMNRIDEGWLRRQITEQEYAASRGFNEWRLNMAMRQEGLL